METLVIEIGPVLKEALRTLFGGIAGAMFVSAITLGLGYIIGSLLRDK